MRKTARESGIEFQGKCGKNNDITDLGVQVGHSTVISGSGKLDVGKGPVRTGVTAIHPRKSLEPVFGNWYSSNGNGEMTGTTWLEESGFVEGPICITNTHSVGTVRDTVIQWLFEHNHFDENNDVWALPIVAETWDGRLNDLNGFHVKPNHVMDALNSAKAGNLSQGNVGGGTGMICHQFKGGIGSSSRVLSDKEGGYSVGVIVQANYGYRELLTIQGAPIGRKLKGYDPVYNTNPPETETGSIIAIVATDAPLLPHQLRRIARRVPFGLARMGGTSGNSSGDIFLSFSTANEGAYSKDITQVEMLSNEEISPLFLATIQATEEAITNALFCAETMTGINDNTVYGIPHDEVIDLISKYT